MKYDSTASIDSERIIPIIFPLSSTFPYHLPVILFTKCNKKKEIAVVTIEHYLLSSLTSSLLVLFTLESQKNR